MTENWDDDFGDIDGVDFSSSVASSTAASLSLASPIDTKYNRQPACTPDEFDNELFDEGYDDATIKVRKKDRAVSKQKAPAAAPALPASDDFEDGFEDGFERGFAEGLLSRERLLRLRQVDEMPELELDSASLRNSVFSDSAYSATTETSEDDGFLDGFELPPDKNLRFLDQERLVTNSARRRHEAPADTQSSSDSDMFADVELDDDAFGDDSYYAKGTLHKNVKFVKSLAAGAQKAPLDRRMQSLSLKAKQSMPVMRHSSSQQQNLTLRGKPSTTSFAARPAASAMHASPPKRLRAAHSMLNLTNTAKPIRTPRGTAARQYTATGHELDIFDELSTNMESERSFTVTPKASRQTLVSRRPLEDYSEISTIRLKNTARGSADMLAAPAGRNGAPDSRSHRRRHKHKGPNLIRQLGTPAAQNVKQMRYNADRMVWEGNEHELKKFDGATPGLIAFISNKGVQVVGDMMFDPVKMCWVKKRDGAADAEDDDPFAGLADLDASVQSSAVAASSTPSAAAGNEFNVTSDFVKKQHHEAERWAQKTKAWFRADETFSREYLYELRNMVVN